MGVARLEVHGSALAFAVCCSNREHRARVTRHAIGALPFSPLPPLFWSAEAAAVAENPISTSMAH